ncbi:MAG: alpha-glucosidase C-terminal domain-containing protein [Ignavibacteriales bacterium]|nr:alpha-glucosidase C-terminal domain-containing protein [Ignavibacteriales bacterium]
MLTIPGLPVVYYGSEFGMTGADDPDNRRMMRFGDALSLDEKKMLADARTIIRMRNRHSALRYGDFLTLIADNSIYAYLRSDMNERLLVLLNKDETSRTISLHLPEMYQATSLVNIVNGETIKLSGLQTKLSIDPVSWQIYRLQ